MQFLQFIAEHQDEQDISGSLECCLGKSVSVYGSRQKESGGHGKGKQSNCGTLYLYQRKNDFLIVSGWELKQY